MPGAKIGGGTSILAGLFIYLLCHRKRHGTQAEDLDQIKINQINQAEKAHGDLDAPFRYAPAPPPQFQQGDIGAPQIVAWRCGSGPLS